MGDERAECYQQRCNSPPRVGGHHNILLTQSSLPVLRFNEPDQITGSNLQPIEAAELWMQFMQPFAGKAKLCSPQISSASPGNTNWMDQFLQVCSGCTIDCIGFHASSLSQPTVSSLELYAETIINRYNKPLWLSQVRRLTHDNVANG